MRGGDETRVVGEEQAQAEGPLPLSFPSYVWVSISSLTE